MKKLILSSETQIVMLSELYKII